MALMTAHKLLDSGILSHDDTPQVGDDAGHTMSTRWTYMAIPFLGHPGVGIVLFLQFSRIVEGNIIMR